MVLSDLLLGSNNTTDPELEVYIEQDLMKVLNFIILGV